MGFPAFSFSTTAEDFTTAFVEAIEHPNAEEYDIGMGYSRSKAANVLTAGELARRAGEKLKAYSVHPGAIYTNIQFEEESRAYMQSVGFVGAEGKPTNEPGRTFKTIPQGAATTVIGAFGPWLEDKSGSYLEDCVEANDAIAPHSSDPVMAQKLWALTEKIIGGPFHMIMSIRSPNAL